MCKVKTISSQLCIGLCIGLIMAVLPFQSGTNAYATDEQHVHRDQCYAEKLICQEKDHEHKDECFEKELICENDIKDSGVENSEMENLETQGSPIKDIVQSNDVEPGFVRNSYAIEGVRNENTGTLYSTLAEAMNATSDGDVLKVCGNLGDQGTISVSKNITLIGDAAAEINGIKLTVEIGKSLNLGNGTGNLSLINDVTIDVNGSLTLNNGCTINASRGKTIIEIKNGGNYLGNGGSVTNTYTTSNYASAIQINVGGIGEFRGGNYTAEHEALFVCGTVTSISNGTFISKNVSTTTKRGAVVVQDDSSIPGITGLIKDISGGTFTGENGGSGMQVMYNGKVENISGGTFTGQGSDGKGCVLYSGRIDSIVGGSFYGSDTGIDAIGLWIVSSDSSYQASSVGKITGGYFYGNARGLCLDAQSFSNVSATSIDSISNATIKGRGNVMFIYGSVGYLEDVTVDASGSSGIPLTLWTDSTIGEIKSGTFLADVTRFPPSNAVNVADGAKIDTITDGNFIGGNSAISTTGTGNVGVIKSGVFYGRYGQPLNLSTPTKLEPDLTAPRGLGRYLTDANKNPQSMIASNNIITPEGYIMSTATVPVTVAYAERQYHYLTKVDSELEITFNANGGIGADYTQDVPYNTAVELLENKFTFEGKNFVGWTTDANSDVVEYVDKAEITTITNTTLYALWDTAMYDVNFAFTTIAPDGIIPPNQTTVAHGDIVSEPTFAAEEGWLFDGWYKDEACTQVYEFTEAIVADMTLYAKWEQLSYQVDYAFTTVAPDGVIPPTTMTVVYGDTVIKPVVASVDGWLFDGWYKDEACTQVYEFTEAIVADMTLYAKWNHLTYYVTFEFITVAPDGVIPPTTMTVAYGDTVIEPVVTFVDGWLFDGWYKDETCTEKYEFSHSIIKDMKLYGKWSKQAEAAETDGFEQKPVNDLNNNVSDQEQPQTGDETRIVFYLNACVGVTLLILILLIMKKREKIKQIRYRNTKRR